MFMCVCEQTKRPLCLEEEYMPLKEYMLRFENGRCEIAEHCRSMY